MNIAQWKKPICTGCLYDSNYMAFWNRQNYKNSKQISSSQESVVVEEEMTRWSTDRIFLRQLKHKLFCMML